MWDAWLDLALGSRCVVCSEPGRVLCAGCAASLPVHGLHVRPDPEPPGLAPVYVAGPYADPLKRLLIAHKERRVLALADPLGRLLAAAVEALGEPDGELLLVAVPSRGRAVRARGHDPVARMVRSAARHLGARGNAVRAPALLRQHRTVPDQAGLNAEDRAVNLSGALRVDAAVHRRFVGRTVTVVVCDDIVTTAATAREAQRALEAVGFRVAAVAAVAATERRRADGPRVAGLLPNCRREG